MAVHSRRSLPQNFSSKSFYCDNPNTNIENYFDLSFYEQQDLWFTVNYCKEALAKLFNPDGFNIGINIGKDAGQSIFHTHIHLIPRYKGDVENPKGGVRGVIPNKQNY